MALNLILKILWQNVWFASRIKLIQLRPPGLLQPLSIPSQRLEEISMDFITGLPKSEGKSVIIVVGDILTKYAHFCALSHPLKQVHFLLHLWKQFKSYMETQRLL